jgi:hypothetical protein
MRVTGCTAPRPALMKTPTRFAGPDGAVEAVEGGGARAVDEGGMPH